MSLVFGCMFSCFSALSNCNPFTSSRILPGLHCIWYVYCKITLFFFQNLKFCYLHAFYTVHFLPVPALTSLIFHDLHNRNPRKFECLWNWQKQDCDTSVYHPEIIVYQCITQKIDEIKFVYQCITQKGEWWLPDGHTPHISTGERGIWFFLKGFLTVGMVL